MRQNYDQHLSKFKYHKFKCKLHVNLYTNCIQSFLQRLKSNPDADEKEIARLTAHLMEQNQPHDRAWYRSNAIRKMTGGTPLTTPLTDKSSEVITWSVVTISVLNCYRYCYSTLPNNAL